MADVIDDVTDLAIIAAVAVGGYVTYRVIQEVAGWFSGSSSNSGQTWSWNWSDLENLFTTPSGPGLTTQEWNQTFQTGDVAPSSFLENLEQSITGSMTIP
jgi:hypothetical protein